MNCYRPAAILPEGIVLSSEALFLFIYFFSLFHHNSKTTNSILTKLTHNLHTIMGHCKFKFGDDWSHGLAAILIFLTKFLLATTSAY